MKITCGYTPGKTYDIIFTLGGGLQPTDSELRVHGFRTTSYEDTDGCGMLGGYYRVLATYRLWRRKAAQCFGFTTGVTERNLSFEAAHTPTEARVYSQDFIDLTWGTGGFDLILEENSTTTQGNLEEILMLIRDKGWRHVAIVTSLYHIPRVNALLEWLTEDLPLAVTITLIAAEDVLKTDCPNVYDSVIDAAYASALAAQRGDSEKAGIASIVARTYGAGDKPRKVA